MSLEGQTPAANPLLDFAALPRFGEIEPEHVAPAVDALIAEVRASVERVVATAGAPTWEGFVAPLAAAQDRLDRAWGQVAHLNAVANTPALREAHNACLPRLTALHTDLGQDERLFAAFRTLAASADFGHFEPARRKLIENSLRDFRLAGAELPAQAKARYKGLEEELASLGSRFEDNVLDATNAYALYVEDADLLAGIPLDVLAAARQDASREGRSGCKLTLRGPCYHPVLQHAERRSLRETLYRASAVRASEWGEPALDNTALIGRILQLRQQAAHLLGYRNFAEVSLVSKMARTPEEVLQFLRNLAAQARPYAERDIAALRSLAKEELGLDALAAWDVAYLSEKLRQARYRFAEEDVRQYFPEDKVLSGLFWVAQTVFGIRIRESSAATWQAGVRFFDVVDGAGVLLGQFYLDLHARPHKRGGAWMDHAIHRRRDGAGGPKHPVAYLVCNFSAPVIRDGRLRPALFTHDEVQTLFHEFGHGLHHLLTRVDVPGVSGLEGVEWDAVELPSQLMENFCWEWDVLRQMSAHVDTGEPLPRTLFERMRAAKNFQSGLDMVCQLELALFDMHLHFDFDATSGRPALDLLRAIRRDIGVMPRPDYDRAPNTFTHIFAGGYAAGYYSYKWAEVLAADAYSLFEDKGVLSAEPGARFRDEVLARGGSRSALESFVAFRGRPPQIDALLRHNGMSTS